MVLSCWSNSHVIAGKTVDEQLEQLRTNYMKMEQVLAAKDRRLESLELKVQHQAVLEAQVTRLETEMNQMKDQSNRAPIHQHESPSNIQKSQMDDRNALLRQGTSNMPKSCADLKIMGHTSSGIFLIKGVKTVETVFCDFSLVTTNPKFQTWVGYADIKSTPVSFHAQRVGVYDDADTVVSYNLMRSNVGNALNPSTGVFVAPRPGKYYFAFTGLSLRIHVKVQLQMKIGLADWTKIGEAYATPWNTMALQSTLQLAKGDQIRLVHIHGIIHDTEGNNFTNFVGLLLEEDVFDC